VRMHRLVGFWSFWLLLAHIVLQVLGYAVHRFKDLYAAFQLKQRAWLPAEWANPGPPVQA